MVMTMLEARVKQEQWPVLEAAYAEAVRELDAGIEQTFLLHSSEEPEAWSIATIWASRETLTQMRQSRGTPRGVLMFREAGAEPRLAIFDVVRQAATSVA